MLGQKKDEVYQGLVILGFLCGLHVAMLEPLIPWSFLPGVTPPLTTTSKQPNMVIRSFVSTLSHACDVPLSQLQVPCPKGDAIAIKLPEKEYQEGLESRKNNLNDHMVLLNKDTLPHIHDLRKNLSALWKLVGNQNLISFGKGYFEFSFSLGEDMRQALMGSSQSPAPGVLRLFTWSSNFNPNMVRLSNTHWLPQEYWRQRIVFSIAWGVRVPLALDDATTVKSFGHFARVLVDLYSDLKQ